MPSYVVVGASRGLGYAWLQNLSADKANTVIGLARTPASVEAKLSDNKIDNVHIVQADMVDSTSLTAAVSEVSKLTNGSVDYLIVNGAYQNAQMLGLTPAAFAGQDDILRQEFHQNMEVNVIGPVLTINAFLPLVRKSSIKKITVISTGMADFEFIEKAEIPFAVAYGALKAALNVIVLKYSLELKSEGIIFLALSPGVVDTREEQPTEEEIAGFMVMLTKFRKLYPDFKGPIKAPESVEMQRKVVEKVTLEQTGLHTTLLLENKVV